MGSVLELIYFFSQSSHQYDEHYKKIMTYIVPNSFCLKMAQQLTHSQLCYTCICMYTHMLYHLIKCINLRKEFGLISLKITFYHTWIYSFMLHSNEVFLGGGLYVPIRSVVQTFKLHIHNIGI
jgi:hypothetical protein